MSATPNDGFPVVSDEGRLYLQFHLTGDVGPVRLRSLREQFGTLTEALGASVSQLQKASGIGPQTAEAIFRSRNSDAVDREIQRAEELGLRIVCAEDDDYPNPLRTIPDPPICLYVLGRLEPQDAVAVAVVGTRKCSHYGRDQALRFGALLGNAGFTVVSGMARGIDGHAHRGALKSGGRTIAVLGNGLASIYPPENASLAQEIAASGAVITEVPIDAGPSRENFPRRNRIIAGFSLGIIIVEAGQRSGALITARLATEYNREVFALPGRVDQPDRTAGSNGLIRKSEAKLITCLDDVLDELGPVGEIMGVSDPDDTPSHRTELAPPSIPSLSENERAVWMALDEEPNETEAIVTHCGLDAARTMSALTSLQIKGLVTRSAGQRFSRRRPAPSLLPGR